MTTSVPIPPEFALDTSVIENGLTVEASAGSGKTFSVAGMVAKLLATNEDLRISELLVTTFTRNAAAELRDRVRRQLMSLEKALRTNVISESDKLAQSLVGPHQTEYANRLARAVREFDSATISTIHSVCSRVMAMAGLPVVGEGRTDSDIQDLIKNVVNSKIISYVLQPGSTKITDVERFSERMASVVAEVLSSPRSKLLVDNSIDELGDATSPEFVHHVRLMVRQCVRRITELTRSDPTFNDLLLRTAQILGPGGDAAVAEAFRSRFKLAIIDEAQDTDQLQWEIFKSAFAATERDRKLVTVGDPKQAIYRFRGADVEAYLSNRDDSKVQTLTRNWRSDAQLIAALNAVFADETFGEGISYLPVTAREGAAHSSIGVTPSLTLLNVGQTGNANDIVRPTAQRVVELLNTVVIADGERTQRLRPKELCVLVTSRTNGSKIEAALRQLDVPAVSSGTESVMEGVMASDIRRLLRAMASMGNESALRLAAATVFIGAQLKDLASISDDDLAVYAQRIYGWNTVLRRKGVSALAHEIRRNSDVVTRMVSGRDGERRETDFAHIIELLHTQTEGKGCTADTVIEAFDRLAQLNATVDTVTRRVESDRDAVQIMTVHAAKGLEFPVVVVADLWKVASQGGGKPKAPFFYRQSETGRDRTIDADWIHSKESETTTAIKKAEEEGEKKRLFYVAMTRAKHHVSLIYTEGTEKRLTDGLLEKVADVADGHCIEIRKYVPPSTPVAYVVPKDENEETLVVATISRPVITTYRRLSFSGITQQQRGQASSPVAAIESIGGGSGDDDEIITIQSGYSDDSVDAGVPKMPLARIPGGTYFGTVMHKVYELIDFAALDLRGEVQRVVDDIVVGSLSSHRTEIIDGVLLSLNTPLGGELGSVRLTDITRDNRLDELGFEMGLADLASQVTVSEIGTIVKDLLVAADRKDDVLMEYLTSVENSFTTQLVGLMNGSIDALLRVPINGEEKFFITDYKTNRLDRDGVDTMIDGYSRDSMLEEMEHHDYPLQALIYGVSVYRFLRWARPDIDADAAIAGFAYFFVRGMVGDATPNDENHRHGVFTWSAPPGLWSALSNLFSRVTS